MTEKELRKLTRTDLLEMLVASEKEYESLKRRITELEKQLEDRSLKLRSAGSIAEASLLLNGVFEAAQAAADQYIAELKNSCASLDQEIIELREKTEAECAQLRKQAKEDAQKYWDDSYEKLKKVIEAHDYLKKGVRQIRAGEEDARKSE